MFQERSGSSGGTLCEGILRGTFVLWPHALLPQRQPSKAPLVKSGVGLSAGSGRPAHTTPKKQEAVNKTAQHGQMPGA